MSATDRRLMGRTFWYCLVMPAVWAAGVERFVREEWAERKSRRRWR